MSVVLLCKYSVHLRSPCGLFFLLQGKCLAEGVDEHQLSDDVQKLVEGPSEERQSHYVLAALSDIHALFTSSKSKSKGKKMLLFSTYSEQFFKLAFTFVEWSKLII